MSSGNRREDTRGWFGFVLNRACWIPSGAIPSVLGGHGPPYPSHPCSAGTARHIRWAARPTSNRFRRETENEGRPTSDSPKFKSSCRAMHSEVHVVKQGHMCRSSGVPPPVQGVLDETLPPSGFPSSLLRSNGGVAFTQMWRNPLSVRTPVRLFQFATVVRKSACVISPARRRIRRTSSRNAPATCIGSSRPSRTFG